jgi:hypothetical protein
MPCCGERRRSLSQSLAKPVPLAAPPVGSKNTVSVKLPQRPVEAAYAPVLLRYVGKTNIVVRGQVTNKPYAFPAGGSVVPVDARDAVILLRSNVFHRA